jgi:hypothetical protein
MTTPGRRWLDSDEKRSKPRGPDIVLTDHPRTPIQKDTRDSDIENLSKVQNARPLKPPRRRQA